MTLTSDLDQAPSQQTFATLVGISQQRVSKLIADGVLSRDGSLRDWIAAYCESLRQEAAGRGGDDQSSLASARAEQARTDAQLKKLQYHREIGNLVPVEELEPLIANWAATARSEVRYAGEKLLAHIRSAHDIEVGDDLLDEFLTPAFKAIADWPSVQGGDEGGSRDG
jgi:hypothetical protein